MVVPFSDVLPIGERALLAGCFVALVGIELWAGYLRPSDPADRIERRLNVPTPVLGSLLALAVADVVLLALNGCAA